jgi:hypothetical protein
MRDHIKFYLRSEAGIVSVDWVMMTAGGVALGLAAIAVLSGGMNDLSGEVQGAMLEADPADQGFPPFTPGADLIAD